MKLERILVPVDFSPSALEAATTAVDLLRERGGGKVILLHVIDVIYYDYGWLGGSVAIPRDVMDHNRDKLKERLDHLLSGDAQSGVTVETRIVEGQPFDEIVRMATKEKPDLIVIGTHGRRGLSHVFLGSVAERVVRLSPVPVLTVKAERAED